MKNIISLITTTYDKPADCLYASFGLGEPSLSYESLEWLLIEYGMFSGIATGFRVIDFSKVIERYGRDKTFKTIHRHVEKFKCKRVEYKKIKPSLINKTLEDAWKKI